HRLLGEGGEVLFAVQIGLQPAAERIGAGFLVEVAPGLALLGVVAVVEVGQEVFHGLAGGQFAVAQVQHGGAAVGLLVDQVDDAVTDRHGGSGAVNEEGAQSSAPSFVASAISSPGWQPAPLGAGSCSGRARAAGTARWDRRAAPAPGPARAPAPWSAGLPRPRSPACRGAGRVRSPA